MPDTVEKTYPRGREDLDLLLEVSEALTRTAALNEVIGPVLQRMAARMGMLRGTITILNRATGAIVIEDAFGLSPHEMERGRYALGEGITGKVIATGEPEGVAFKGYLPSNFLAAECEDAGEIPLDPEGYTYINMLLGPLNGWIGLTGGGGKNYMAYAFGITTDTTTDSVFEICDGCGATSSCVVRHSFDSPISIRLGDHTVVHLRNAVADHFSTGPQDPGPFLQLYPVGLQASAVKRLSKGTDGGHMRADGATQVWISRPKDANRFYSQCARQVHRAGIHADDAAGSGQNGQQCVERLQQRRSVLGEDLFPDVGVGAGDAGHVADALTSQPEVILGDVDEATGREQRVWIQQVANLYAVYPQRNIGTFLMSGWEV